MRHDHPYKLDDAKHLEFQLDELRMMRAHMRPLIKQMTARDHHRAMSALRLFVQTRDMEIAFLQSFLGQAVNGMPPAEQDHERAAELWKQSMECENKLHQILEETHDKGDDWKHADT